MGMIPIAMIYMATNKKSKRYRHYSRKMDAFEIIMMVLGFSVIAVVAGLVAYGIATM